MEALWQFGRLINNTDMHLGNLSLSMDGKTFRLLPLYDMCSMGFAPRSGAEVQPFAFVPPEATAFGIGDDLMNTVKKAACDFWKSVAGDERISDEFREYLQEGNPVGRI